MRQRDRNKRRRVERQDEAAARALAHGARTDPEQLHRITLRPGESRRESDRLIERMNADTEARFAMAAQA